MFLSSEREVWLGRTQGLEIKVLRFLPRRAVYGKWEQPKGTWNHVSFLTKNVELQDLVFVLLDSSCFGPVFPHYSPFFPFGMVMYILCYSILEVYNLLFDLLSVTIKRLL